MELPLGNLWKKLGRKLKNSKSIQQHHDVVTGYVPATLVGVLIKKIFKFGAF